jgi:hypothetical protein
MMSLGIFELHQAIVLGWFERYCMPCDEPKNIQAASSSSQPDWYLLMTRPKKKSKCVINKPHGSDWPLHNQDKGASEYCIS